jgi:hypothetical protein
LELKVTDGETLVLTKPKNPTLGKDRGDSCMELFLHRSSGEPLIHWQKSAKKVPSTL